MTKNDMLSLDMHKKWRGKIAVESPCDVNDALQLAIAYTPGVAAPCLEIQKNTENSYVYTARGNLVAVITDGTAVLGLGDIGPEAGMPVMEGKCMLFKKFANVDAFPLCVRSRDPDEIIRTVELLAGSFGGINLEDISAPRCFEIEKKLKERLDIPVFHDDQHGTAIVVLASMINALKVAKKELASVKAIVNGAGAAGIACTRLLCAMGLANVIVCDKQGAIYEGMPGLNSAQHEISLTTNRSRISGTLSEVIEGADVFLGFSAAGCLTGDMVKKMADRAIVLACANPIPEIFPDEALSAGAMIVGTGRSDFPNQINNLLAFPGIFRGALDVRATEINDEMKIAAAYAIAGILNDKDLNEQNIIPSPFNKRVVPAVAQAVARAAKETGICRS